MAYSSGDVLDIPVWKIKYKKRMVSDPELKTWVGAVPARLRSGPIKTHKDAARAVSTPFSSSSGVLDADDDIAIYGYDIV